MFAEYCNICGENFACSIEKHLLKPKHLAYTNNKENYKDFDELKKHGLKNIIYEIETIDQSINPIIIKKLYEESNRIKDILLKFRIIGGKEKLKDKDYNLELISNEIIHSPKEKDIIINNLSHTKDTTNDHNKYDETHAEDFSNGNIKVDKNGVVIHSGTRILNQKNTKSESFNDVRNKENSSVLYEKNVCIIDNGKDVEADFEIETHENNSQEFNNSKLKVPLYQVNLGRKNSLRKLNQVNYYNKVDLTLKNLQPTVQNIEELAVDVKIKKDGNLEPLVHNSKSPIKHNSSTDNSHENVHAVLHDININEINVKPTEEKENEKQNCRKISLRNLGQINYNQNMKFNYFDKLVQKNNNILNNIDSDDKEKIGHTRKLSLRKLNQVNYNL